MAFTAPHANALFDTLRGFRQADRRQLDHRHRDHRQRLPPGSLRRPGREPWEDADSPITGLRTWPNQRPREDSDSLEPSLSVVIPLCNEAENVASLTDEILTALTSIDHYEIILVDDGSDDATAAEMVAARQRHGSIVRLLHHSVRSGQSAAVCSGVRAARARWIATLDGDGQNDPADLPRLLTALSSRTNPRLDLVMGNRGTRRDSWLRRISSRVANRVRGGLLGDATPDSGCGIKVFARDVFLDLPRFDHMHRFLPALFQRAGSDIVSLQVTHRPRLHGRSKYGLHNRLWVGIVDMIGVLWLLSRQPPPRGVEEYLRGETGTEDASR